jgi:hypothetical protein
MVVMRADRKVDSLADLLVVMKAVMMAGWMVDMMDNRKVVETAEKMVETTVVLME